MKKLKTLCFVLVFALLISACGKPAESESQTESFSSVEESQPANGEIDRTWPYVTGTFMQPWAFTNYTADNWKAHFNGLLEVGIDTFIIQWIAETPGGEFKACFYPSKYTENNALEDFQYCPDMLESCLSAAEELGLKVFVGLNLGNDWWSTYWSIENWNMMQAKLGTDMAVEIYELYKDKYPNALYGWYFAWEMYNGMNGYESQAGRMLNYYMKPLTELDASMPFMLSPFIRDNQGGAEKAGDEWTKVFETAEFREGDIFCLQDAMGSDWVNLEILEEFLIHIKRAVDSEPGLLFWANNENFTGGAGSADILRFIRQMEISRQYVEGFITFSYSHYYAKDYNNKGGYHHAYKHYYDTGETDFGIEMPKITFMESENNLKINVYIKNNPAGLRTLYIYDGEELVKEYNFLINKLDEEAFDLNFNIPLENAAECYEIRVNDYYGNIFSEMFTVD